MKVTMPYIGRSLSVNCYKIVGKRGLRTNKTRPETERWMNQLISKVKDNSELEMVFGKPVVVELFGKFEDRRSTPDIHNLHKVIGDALQVALDIDDKFIKFEDKGFELGFPFPSLEIFIRGC